MSKRKRVPAPFSRIIPHVIRTFGPRLVLIGGAIVALILLFTGGSYLISRVDSPPPKPPASKSYKKLSSQAPPDAQVLGEATTDSNIPANQGSGTQSVTTPTVPTSAGSHNRENTEIVPQTSSHTQVDAKASSANNLQVANGSGATPQSTSASVRTPLLDLNLNL